MTGVMLIKKRTLNFDFITCFQNKNNRSAKFKHTIVVVVVDCFYIVLFSTLKQTLCAHVTCNFKWLTIFLQHALNIHPSDVLAVLLGSTWLVPLEDPPKWCACSAVGFYMAGATWTSTQVMCLQCCWVLHGWCHLNIHPSDVLAVLLGSTWLVPLEHPPKWCACSAVGFYMAGGTWTSTQVMCLQCCWVLHGWCHLNIHPSDVLAVLLGSTWLVPLEHPPKWCACSAVGFYMAGDTWSCCHLSTFCEHRTTMHRIMSLHAKPQT